MGALTLSVLLPKLLSQWFKDGELGLAMGIFNTGVPLGSAISFGLLGRLGNLWGWRIPILLTGIYSLIIAILFYTFYRRPPFQRMENGKSPSLYQSLKEMELSIWGVGLSWLWFNAAFVSFATFAPNFFLQKDYTIEQSGLLIGTPLLGSLLFSAPIGYLVDRFKHQEWFIGIGAFALAFLTLFFNFNFSFLLLVIMMGVFSALIPAPIYSLPPEILKIETVGLGFGVISTCSSIGMLGAPYFIGVVRDLTGADHWSFILISLFFLLTGVSILLPRCFPSIRSSEVKG
jgi:MFS family permease